MLFGCFGSEGQLETIAEAGYDTVELDAFELAGLAKNRLFDFYRRADRSGIRFDVLSGLIPLSVRFHSPSFDKEYWLKHVKNVCEIAGNIGCHMIPLGAGKCRSIPEDCNDAARARQTVREIVYSICEIFDRYGIEMVIEPLGPANSNFLNLIGETAQFAGSVGLENCHTMCDLRHMVKLGESLGDIKEHIGEIHHAHIDYPGGTLRRFPLRDDGYDYSPYLNALHDAGYDRILTIEATYSDCFQKDCEESLAYLKELAGKLGYIVS